jgi:hypothetical protein
MEPLFRKLFWILPKGSLWLGDDEMGRWGDKETRRYPEGISLPYDS